MSTYFIAVRRPERTDQPQAVYKGALGLKLWEGPLSVSIADAERNCGYRTADGARLDVRGHEWAPAFTWVERVVETNVAQWMPAATGDRKGERTPDRPPLDVRRFEPCEPAWIFKNLPAAAVTTAQAWPAIQEGTPSFRSADRAVFDSRQGDWASAFTWVNTVVDRLVQQWRPTFDAELAGGLRTPSGPTLDVRGYDWSAESGWTGKAVDAVVRTWAPVWNAEVGYRSPARPVLDVRGYEWSPAFSWAERVVEATVSAWAPVWAAERSDRTADRALLDVRTDWAPLPAWVFTNLPPSVSIAQFWPAILEGIQLSYRSADRGVLDVRGHEWSPGFGWVQSLVDATVRTWAGVWAAELGYRTSDRAVFDVRGDGLPELAWIVANLPPTLTTAQIWPAILHSLLSYRTPDGLKLDVLRTPWAPTDGWLNPVVDRLVASWLPIFNAETSLRTPDGPRLDVRVYEWSPEGGWLPKVVDATLAAWLSVWAAEAAGFRTAPSGALDVRSYDWMPVFSWPAPVVDAAVRLWMPIWSAAAQSFRTADVPPLDVRRTLWLPEDGWRTVNIPAPPPPSAATTLIFVGDRLAIRLGGNFYELLD